MARDAVAESVTRLDVGVPQGRGRLDAEAGEATAEKNRRRTIRTPVPQTDTGRRGE